MKQSMSMLGAREPSNGLTAHPTSTFSTQNEARSESYPKVRAAPQSGAACRPPALGCHRSGMLASASEHEVEGCSRSAMSKDEP